MKRVLLTGITGYIGSNLARRLLPDCEVYGLVREPLNLEYLGDIQEKIRFLFYDGTYESVTAAMAASCPDLVYHLATYYTGSHQAELLPKLLDSNIVYGSYLLEAMWEHQISGLIYASTVMAHYQNKEYCPLNLYAATKQAFSDLLAYYADAGFLRAVTLVLSDTYGPGDRRPKILNRIKKAVQTGTKLALSDGEQDYDVIYIDDVVRAFCQAGEQLLERPEWKNKTFQVRSTSALTLRQTVEKMIAVNQLSWEPDWGQRPPADREIRRAVRLYPTLPGWRPEVFLEDGLQRFAEQ